MIKKVTAAFGLMLAVCAAHAQQKQTDEDAVKATIQQLFSGMQNADSAAVSAAFDSNALLQTVRPAGSAHAVRTEQLSGLLTAVAKMKKGTLDERIVFTAVNIDGPLASVWTDYKFFNAGVFSHCGVNSFQLVKKDNGWKIVYLIDTRRKEPCKP